MDIPDSGGRVGEIHYRLESLLNIFLVSVLHAFGISGVTRMQTGDVQNKEREGRTEAAATAIFCAIFKQVRQKRCLKPRRQL